MDSTQGIFGIALLLALINVYASSLVIPRVSQARENKSGYVWIEGENPDRQNFEVQGSGWGNKDYLSEESWLNISIPADEVEAKVPEGGIILSYDFEASEAGEYQVWNRIGYEFVRSDFQWRIDSGEWQEITSQQLTIDLMEISFWCEVAWLKMGDVQLSAGQHTLEIRHLIAYKEENGERKPQRILYASDAICVYPGSFRPNSRRKPDEQWQTEMDKQAAEHLFRMPAGAAGGERTELPLTGLWQIARFDESGLVENRTGPIESRPNADDLYWQGISVPGDRNSLRPEMYFCHRYFYRTRVDIPADFEGQSFFLHFVETSMLATIFVNGERVAFHDAPMTGFLADVTGAIRPGQVNEIWVGIKDSYYAIASSEESPNTRYSFNLPRDMMRNQGVTMRFDFPMFGHGQNGILDTVKLVATGKAYTEDVYAIPSVRQKQLTLEITIRNSTAEDLTVRIDNEIVPLAGGAAAKTFAPQSRRVAAGQSVTTTLAEDWENPHLWWPDAPYQYNVITRLRVNGKIVDLRKTKFGFREWSIEGKRFVLNGVPWQLRANLDYYDSGKGKAEEAVKRWRETGQNMFRLRFQRNWGGMTQNQALDFFDEHGVPVRKTCSTFDGQMASYGLVEDIEKDGKRVKVARTPLFENWRKQIAGRLHQQRNHPCIFVWELDNEIIYINTRNFGNLDVVEPEFEQAAELVQQMDKQGRGVMVAGGRALMAQSLPINGCHYEALDDRHYPDMAYGLGEWTGPANWQVWPMALDKPIFLSEEFFAHGRKPADFASVGGEICFLGRAETKGTCGLLAKMYSEGYRWQELAAFMFWFGNYGAAQYNSWQPVMALCREWNWTFGGDTKVKRTIMVRNDTRFSEPVDMQWEFVLNGKSIARARKTYQIQPGHGVTTEIVLHIPEVATRTSGEFLLTCYRNGQKVWSEQKDVWVINPEEEPRPEIDANQLLVWDPHGSAQKRLRQRGIQFTSIDGPDQLPQEFEVIIVGKDALSARQATSQPWYALASQGKRVLVLEQQHPLHYQAVPADFEVTDYTGRVAFAEDLAHPAFRGLAPSDFFCWSNDHVVYRKAYVKASRGARSLAQCDHQLSCSALAECPVDEGLMLLCQMVVGEKLANDVVAQRLFDNLLNYAVDYEPVKNTTAVVMKPFFWGGKSGFSEGKGRQSEPRRQMLEESNLKYEATPDALSAIRNQANGIVVADAIPATLKELADNRNLVETFTQRGGWLMLWGVTPQGLHDFNKLVGFDHAIRPFRREKVQLAAVRDPLTSGLSQRDVVLLSGERIFGWTSDEYVADDVFTYVVDLDNLAPFMQGQGIEGTASLVNGFTSTEAWKYIVYYELNEDGRAPAMEYKLAKPETIIGFSIVPNNHYHLIKKLRFIFDGDRDNAVTIELAGYDKQNNDRQDFDIPERRCEKKLTIEPVAWDEVGDRPIIGIDNLWIRAKRTPEFRTRVRPLLNIGALVKYPQGKGGIILNQLNIQEHEAVPVNGQKKQTILVTLLRNLQAVFSGRKTILPGEGLNYQPISLEGRCNLYITAGRGWPDKQYDLAHLPLGRQKFAGVNYVIRDFKTSPLEGAITLAGMPGVAAPEAVTGLAINKKAEALFFLHTFYRQREWKPDRRAHDAPPVIFRYVVYYADGQNENIDIRYGEGADHFIQTQPAGLKDAVLAWAAPFPDDESRTAVLYQMQWNNPRPDVQIRALDLTHVDDSEHWGTPVLLAITAAMPVQ